jgi:uncharacterized protein YbjT (DUF2867 family)
MLIVTGGSGKLGRRIVQNLLTHVAPSDIGISMPDADKGVRVRRGDYDDADSLRHAWEDAKRLLLIPSNAAATGGDPLAQHATAIAVAREVGIDRIFYTSQISSATHSHFPPGRDHAATEQMLAGSGLAWTALRHGFYAASALAMNERGLKAGRLEGPADGKVSWTSHDDLAAADAMLLVSPDVIDGPTLPLTGSEALDLADIALQASKILGKSIARIISTEDGLEAQARAAGTPEGSIAVMLGYYRVARSGEFSQVDPTLATIIGRPPQTLAMVLEASL